MSLSPAALWRGLFNSDQRRFVYLSRALLCELPVSLAIVATVSVLFSIEGPKFPPQPAWMHIALLCVFAPVVETLFMVLIFAVLRWFTKRQEILITASATIWALLHSTSVVTWGLGVFWPFLVFSICYLTWERKSQRNAIWMTASLHSLHNLGPAILVAIMQR